MTEELEETMLLSSAAFFAQAWLLFCDFLLDPLFSMNLILMNSHILR